LLARSLGIPCYLYNKTNVPGYEERVYWRVVLSGDLSELPTRVVRKQFPKVTSRRFTDRTGFKIEPIGNGPFNGWQLDGDGLFLLGDFTVTHNTSFFISATDENIKRGKRVLIVSAEDPPSLYGDRLLARRSKVSASRLRKRQLEEDEIKRVREVQSKGEDVPVYIQAGNKPIETLAKEITAIMRLEGINMVVFDYLQEFRSAKRHQDERTRFKHTSAVMRDLIRSNNRCGAILSQLTIGSDTKIPNKHNIRESRDVSNAAEVIGIGFSPDADITKPPERDVSGRQLQPEPIFKAGNKYVLIDKNKNGANGRKVEMRWNEHSACFDAVKDPEQERLDRQSQEWDDTIGAEYDDFK
jgi:replicative DNA helicase